jgi:curved DNA-binding protein
MKYKDYYQILGIERGATDEAIKKAYRRLARKYHPDVSKERNAEERFKEVAEAYDTLRDAEKRRAYDQLGRHRSGQEFRPPPDWERQFGDFFGRAGNAGGFDLGDLFAGLGGRRGPRPHRGRDLEATVELTLEELARGTEVRLEIGSGRDARTITARIPRGASEGQKLKVPGKGGPGLQGSPGDLYITIALRPHPIFRADGHDLQLDLPVTPAEAALGAAVEIPTLEGKVRLRIPPGSQSGQKLRLSGRGLAKPGAGHGDLYARIQIVLPAALSAKEKELYQQLAACSTFDPRARLQ